MDWEKKIARAEHPCELYLLTTESTQVDFQDKKLKSINCTENNELSCRVLKDNRLGFSSGAGSISFDKLYSSALAGSKYGKQVQFEFFPGDAEHQEWSTIDPNIEALTQDDLRDLGERLIKQLSHEKPSYNNHSGVTKTKETIRILSNSGLDRSFTRNTFSLGFGINTASEGDIIELFDAFNHIPTQEELDAKIARTCQNLSLCENVVPLETGKFPVLFHPIAFTFLWEPLYTGLNSRAVFEKLSPLQGKINTQILSDKISLTDDPLWVKGDNHCYFDDEGVLSKKRILIDHGILMSYLNNLEYAARLDQEPTGNGFRKDWLTNSRKLSASPNIMPTNRIINEGQAHWQDMMSSIDTGLFLWFTMDCWIGNLINGDFSGTVDLGFKIEQGKPVGRVKNMRLSGNIYNLFNEQLVELSAERDYSYTGHDFFPYALCKDVALS